jgi:hypothetical protein
MKPLNTDPNFHTPGRRHRYGYVPGDDFYECLVKGHEGLSDADSELMNARLVLLLANHIGNLDVLREAIAGARPPQPQPQSQPQEETTRE